MQFLKILAFFSISIACLSLQESKPFFSDYTQVLHFRYPVSEEELSANYYTRNPNSPTYPKALFRELPDELDSKLAETLFHDGFIRAELKKRDFQLVDSIFSSHNVNQYFITECLPVYRDILIFRKKKVVRGIVQLCFTCSKVHIIGANGITLDFGQHGEFSRLKELLYGVDQK